jgi:hypothetical protein
MLEQEKKKESGGRILQVITASFSVGGTNDILIEDLVINKWDLIR